MKKSALLIIGIFFVSIVFSGCIDQENPSEKGVFTFAAGSGQYPPFNFRENGEIKGFDLEIGNALAEKMGMEPNPVTNIWESIILGLQAKKYDAIVGSMTITEDRKEKVSFTDPYYHSGVALFVMTNNTEINSISDLNGKIIGVVKQSSYQQYAQNFTDDVRGYTSDIDALHDLPTGRIDAVITDKFVGLPIIKQGILDIRYVADVKSEDIGIAVRKDDTELLNKLNIALDEIIKDGTYDRISKKWFGENIFLEKKV